MKFHKPCQVEKILQFLQEFNCKFVVDCTAGEGGHSIALAKLVGESGRVIAIEVDPTYFQQLLENTKDFSNITCLNESYTNIRSVLTDTDIKRVDAILFDFGLSSYHIEGSGRGFSFRKEEVLDMRFNPAAGEPLYEKIQKLTEHEIELVLKEFGEVRFARTIARNIYANKNRIKYTSELVEIVKSSIPYRLLNDELPKIFQAFRIFTNNEFLNMATGIKEAILALSKGGILITLSYHSIEDRLCKNVKNIRGMKAITKKPLPPDPNESSENPRCRSSKLRVFQKEEVDEESLVDWYKFNLSLFPSPLLGK